MSLSGRWALVTGATAGIGEQVALDLASRGCSLFITGRRQERLLELKERIAREAQARQGHGENAKVCVVPLNFDVTDRQAVLETIERHEDQLNSLSILVNNAGLARGVDPVHEAQWEDWQSMLDTNIKGLMSVTHALLPFLTAQPQADIINVGSVAGRWTYPGGAVYAATKYAVLAFSEGLRKDLCGQPIRVSCIEPGLVETEFSQVRLQDEEKAKKVYAGMTPLRAPDISRAICWALECPRHMNIQEMVIFPTAQASVSQVHREE